MIVRTGTIHGGFTVGMTTVCRPALLQHLSGSAREKYERWEVGAFVLAAAGSPVACWPFLGPCSAFSPRSLPSCCCLTFCWGCLSMNAAGSVLLRVLAYLALAAFLSLYLVHSTTLRYSC